MRPFLPAIIVLAACCAVPIHAQEASESPDGTTDVEVITASGSRAKYLETPDAVGILDQREISERSHGQLPDMLDGTPGIYSQNTAAGQGSPFIRGMTGKQILLLVDGVRFNNSTFRFGPNQYASSIDPASIARIEVVRGPSSVLYGSDAQGGVINVILKKPEFMSFDYGFGVRGRYESANRRR